MTGFTSQNISELSIVPFSDEKEKYDPGAFRDAIILGFEESNGQLDQVRISFTILSCDLTF